MQNDKVENSQARLAQKLSEMNPKDIIDKRIPQSGINWLLTSRNTRIRKPGRSQRSSGSKGSKKGHKGRGQGRGRGKGRGKGGSSSSSSSGKGGKGGSSVLIESSETSFSTGKGGKGGDDDDDSD